MSIAYICLCLICLSIPHVKSQNESNNKTPEINENIGVSPIAPSSTAPSPILPSPIEPSPTTPSPITAPPTASSPTASSPTAPSPTAPSPTAPPSTAPPPTASSPTAPSPTAPSPTAPSIITPSPTPPTSFTSVSPATNAKAAAIAKQQFAADSAGTDPDENLKETTLGGAPATETEVDGHSSAAASSPSSATVVEDAKVSTETEGDKGSNGDSTTAQSVNNEANLTETTYCTIDEAITTPYSHGSTIQSTNDSTTLGVNDTEVCTLPGTVERTTRVTMPRPAPATSTRHPHSVTSTTVRGHGLFGGGIPHESTTKGLSEDELEWGSVKTIDWIYDYLESVTRRFPKTTKLVTIGHSKDDIPLYAVEVTHKMHSGATIVVDAAMDGRDRAGVIFAIYILHKLIERLNENLLTLNGVKIVVIPLVNPDNYKNTLEGVKSDPCRMSFFRNFDVGDPPSTEGCAKPYFSEPETQAIRDYYTQLSKFKLYINLDSSIPLITFPYGYRTGISKRCLAMAENMKNVLLSHNILGDVITTNLNSHFEGISGTPIDWVYEKLNVRYSLYINLPKHGSTEDNVKIINTYYEAFRYAVLEIQLTDPDVALAIYEDFNESNAPIFINATLIIYTVSILIYFKCKI